MNNITASRNSYTIITKDFKGITTLMVTDNEDFAKNRVNICRNWNPICERTSGKIKSCIAFYNGKYDWNKDQITLYKNGYYLDEFYEGINYGSSTTEN